MDQGRLLALARRSQSRAPMVEIGRAEVTTAEGVVSDSRGAPGPRQVTVLETGGWLAACQELGRDVPWTVRRANLLVSGVKLAGTTGQKLRVGDVELKITGETEPCHRMEEQVAGLFQALVPDWRAGVCCEVIRGGVLEPGLPVTLEPAETSST